MNKFPLLFALLSVGSLCAAQQPEAHTVSFPTGDATWVVEIESLQSPKKDGSTPDEAQIKTIEVASQKGLRRDTIRWAQGGTTQYWWSKAPPVVLFQPRPSGPVLSILPSQLGGRRFDASNFSWVNLTTYRKETTVAGKPAREYSIELPFQDGKRQYTALIEAETARPLVWSDGVIRATFSFGEPLTETLVMPENFRTALKRMAEIEAPAKPLGKR